jgi:hypothetical protein
MALFFFAAHYDGRDKFAAGCAVFLNHGAGRVG